MGIKKASKEKIGKSTKPRKSLIETLFTSTQKKVIGLIFGNPERSFFATEIIRLAGAGSGAVQRELKALTEAGLVSIVNHGKQKYYQANRDSAIFEELHSIIIKTVGLTEPLKNALSTIQDDIDLAFVYGSIAKGTDTATSDIDLLVVSKNISLAELHEALSTTEVALGRKINPTLYTPAEFNKRIQNKNSFVEKVLASKHIMLVGDTNAIDAAR